MCYAAVNPVGDSTESGFRVMVLGYFSRESRRVNLPNGRTSLARE